MYLLLMQRYLPSAPVALPCLQEHLQVTVQVQVHVQVQVQV